MKPKSHEQFELPPQPFDAYNKDLTIQQALGSARGTDKREAADIRSINWVPGVSGWRLTPLGLELGNTSGVFPPGTITFPDIQNISTNRLLGRSTAGSGVIEQLMIGTGLSLSGGTLSATINPGGSDTQVQYNDGGVFAGDSVFTWDKVTKALTVGVGILSASDLIIRSN